MNIDEKYEKLKNILKSMGDVVVAFSGGVDSTFLLKVARDVLGDRVLGIVADSPTYPSREYKEALKTASQIGVKIKVIQTKETENAKFRENPVNRCYLCKTELFTKVKDIAKKENFNEVRKLIKETGSFSVPTIKKGDKIIVGYNKEEIDKLI